MEQERVREKMVKIRRKWANWWAADGGGGSEETRRDWQRECVTGERRCFEKADATITNQVGGMELVVLGRTGRAIFLSWIVGRGD